GSFGVVRAWDYGVEPNRIHCVQWSNMNRAGTSANITATLRIHESGDFDIIFDHSTNGSAMNTNGTVGVEDFFGTNANQLQSAPNTQFPDIATDPLDDYVYQYTFGQQSQYDLSVESTNLKPALAAGNYNVSGRMKNFGSSSVSSFKMNYQLDNNTPVEEQTNTLLLVANGGEFDFYINTQLNLPSAGQSYQLKIWASDLNGNTDENNMNDTLVIDLITVLGNNAPKHVVVEKFTATWCGACPTGIAYMDTLYNNYPGQVYGIANHASDGFSIAQNDLFEFFGVGGIPDGLVDRSSNPFGFNPNAYPTSWPNLFAARLNEPCPVEVEVYNTYDPGTGMVTGQVVSRFVDYAVGDLRMMLFVTEDGLPGNQSGLGAHTFDHILRALPMGEFGTAGTIPANVGPGEDYVNNFSLTLDPSWDINELKFIGAVVRYSPDKRKQEILNAGDAPIDNGVSSANPVTETRSLGIIPNPVSNLGAVAVEFAKPAQARFSLHNSLGQEIRFLKEGRFTAGQHHVWFNGASLPNGVYFLQVKSDQGNFTEKVVISH
ncbi:MAG: Omp28-related outer membrane protein, partial [Bacteroidota bacterium]